LVILSRSVEPIANQILRGTIPNRIPIGALKTRLRSGYVYLFWVSLYIVTVWSSHTLCNHVLQK